MEHPAAVVLDLVGPQRNSFGFLKRFRETGVGRHTPVIVWTAKNLSDWKSMSFDQRRVRLPERTITSMSLFMS
jgi:DNA-binding response OmpR family regulator